VPTLAKPASGEPEAERRNGREHEVDADERQLLCARRGADWLHQAGHDSLFDDQAVNG